MFVPRYYQTEAVQSIFDYYKVNDGNCVLALPTGTGKSSVIALFIMRVLKLWPLQRFMVLTHVKELVTQDADELRLLWPNAPIGIYYFLMTLVVQKPKYAIFSYDPRFKLTHNISLLPFNFRNWLLSAVRQDRE